MNGTPLKLFQFKAWADDQLLNSLAQVDGDGAVLELATKALSHTYVVDRIFAAHLRGLDHPYGSPNLDHMPALEDLSAHLRASDQEYVDYVAGLDFGELGDLIDFTFTDGAAGRMSRGEMLMHVITHGVGHRGQVSALMLLNSLAPAKDGFTTYLHEAEAETRRLAA